MLKYHRPSCSTAVIVPSSSSVVVSTVPRISATSSGFMLSVTRSPIGNALPSTVADTSACRSTLTMSGTLVGRAVTDVPPSVMSTPAMLARSASGASTSSRDSSLTRSIIGCRNRSRSPGNRRSVTPSTSSLSIAVNNAVPSSLGLAAPPSAAPLNRETANTPAAPTASTATTAPAITALERRGLRACSVSTVSTSGPSAGNGPSGGSNSCRDHGDAGGGGGGGGDSGGATGGSGVAASEPSGAGGLPSPGGIHGESSIASDHIQVGELECSYSGRARSGCTPHINRDRGGRA